MAVILRGMAKAGLVLVTFAFLASLAGAMVSAFPVLVPLHWLAARRSGLPGTIGWGTLAGLSLAEVAAMATATAGGRGAVVAVAALVAFGGASSGFASRLSRSAATAA